MGNAVESTFSRKKHDVTLTGLSLSEPVRQPIHQQTDRTKQPIFPLNKSSLDRPRSTAIPPPPRLYAVLEYILLWVSRPARQHKQFENRMTASSGLRFQVFMAWPSVPLETNTFVSHNLLWFYTPFSLSLLLQLLFSQGWCNNLIIVSSFGKDNVVLAVVIFLRRCASKLDQRLTNNFSLDFWSPAASLGYFCPVVYDANH